MTAAELHLLSEAPCGIFSFTEDGVITSANNYCHKILEYNSNEITGLNIASLLTISGRIFYQTHFYPLVKLHKTADEIFLNLVSKTKKDVPVLLNATLSQVEGSAETICSFIPVFNRRKYEDEILHAKKVAEEAVNKNEELEKVKSELLEQQKSMDKQITLLKFHNKELLQLNEIITHDLQEPVRKIILFSNELQKENIEGKIKEHALAVIKRSSQRMKNLLHNLQNYLSLTLETPSKEDVNLDELVRYEIKQLIKDYPQVEANIEIEPLPVITGNKNQLQWMFFQLLQNAFHHGTIDNTLTLSIKSVIVKENMFNSLQHKYTYIDYAKITITDKGKGFQSKYNEYVFDVLKRLNLSGEALGFGLAFCKRITENHFGTIKAEGLTGNGAKFIVMLPLQIPI